MTNVNLTAEKTRIPIGWISPLIAAVIVSTVFVVRMQVTDERQSAANTFLEKTIATNAADAAKSIAANDAKTEKYQEEALAALREMRDDLRKLVNDMVSQRQFTAWLDLVQLTMNAWIGDLRAKNPTMQINDPKLPMLPR